jgi:hypothetical protein
MRGGKMGKLLIEQIYRDLEGICSMSNLTVTDLLGLPDALRLLLRWIVLEKAVTCEQAADFLNATQEEAQLLVQELSALGLIEQLPICGWPRYWVCLNPRRLRPPLELLSLPEE